MAGRNHLPPSALKLREVPLTRAALMDDPRVHHRGPLPPGQAQSRLHPIALMEDRIAGQHHEIQTLFHDNQRLAATHVALKQELAAAEQELRHLSATAKSVKAEGDAQVREVYEKSLKVEAEVRLIEAHGAELAEVKADIQQMHIDRKELTAKLEAIDTDLAKVQSESKQLPSIKSEIEAMRNEVQRGRAAIEYEKKMHANNFEQSQIMEKHMVSMVHEIKKLHAELANAEKRARAAAAAMPGPGYPAGYGNPEIGFGGNSYPDPYAVHQVQGAVNSSSQYGPGSVPHGPSGLYDMQRPDVLR